jgi:hypothetical protein
MAFNKEEGGALDAAVRGVVERAIASLMAIGMTHEDALSLLVLQSVIRMRDMAAARRLLQRLLEDDTLTGGE